MSVPSRRGPRRVPRGSQSRALSALASALLVLLMLFVSSRAWALEATAPGLRAAPAASSTMQAVEHPGDAPIAPGIESAELPTPVGYNVHNGGWVKFSYHPSTLEFVQPLIKEAGVFKAQLEQRLGQKVLQAVDVRIARTPREMRSLAPSGSQVPGYAAGVAYSQIGLILLTIQPLHPNSEHNLVEILKHELVHVALHDAVDGEPIPRWFNEGFAVQASGENRFTRAWTLWSATLSEDLIPLSQLDKGFPADPDSASVAYAQAADFVRFLMRRQDEHRFRAAIERVRAGQSFISSLDDAYGSEISTLEYEWLEDVARRYTFWPVLFSSTVVWMGILGLFVWGWRRRKARAQVTLARWAREEAEEDARRQRDVQEEQSRRVHIVLTRPSETEVVDLGPRMRETDVPKVEHDGRWHTLH